MRKLRKIAALVILNLTLPNQTFGRFLPHEPETSGGSALTFWWAIITLVLALYLAYKESGKGEFYALKMFFGVQLFSIIFFIAFFGKK